MICDYCGNRKSKLTCDKCIGIVCDGWGNFCCRCAAAHDKTAGQASRLHIYGQFQWHAPAYIIGDRNALELLHAALSCALESGGGKARVEASDGEGYEVFVALEDRDEVWDKIYRPYHAGYAEDPRSNAMTPDELENIRELCKKR